MDILDFDRFMAERDGKARVMRILGRDIAVPRELPWWYVMKVERMLETGGSIPGEENIALVRQLLSPEDFDYITHHPDFRASWFWEIIAFGWLRGEAAEDDGAPRFRTEDDMKTGTEEREPKKPRSAP